jgi:aryl-alcohol dehydrogenase-like predicted oxidoreductase
VPAHGGLSLSQPHSATGDDIVPLVGISRRARVAENLASLDVRFTTDERARRSNDVQRE